MAKMTGGQSGQSEQVDKRKEGYKEQMGRKAE